MRDKNQLRMKNEELCESNIHEQVWLECDIILISERNLISLVNTETQNDVKKVAAVMDCNLFYIKNKRCDISLLGLLDLVSLRYLGKLLEYKQTYTY
jgi:hypothetical protein